jgi:hypothetical protein
VGQVGRLVRFLSQSCSCPMFSICVGGLWFAMAWRGVLFVVLSMGMAFEVGARGSAFMASSPQHLAPSPKTPASRPPQHEWLLSGVVGGFLVMIFGSFIYTVGEYFIEYLFQIRHVSDDHLCEASSFIEKLYALRSEANLCLYKPWIARFDQHHHPPGILDLPGVPETPLPLHVPVPARLPLPVPMQLPLPLPLPLHLPDPLGVPDAPSIPDDLMRFDYPNDHEDLC